MEVDLRSSIQVLSEGMEQNSVILLSNLFSPIKGHGNKGSHSPDGNI